MTTWGDRLNRRGNRTRIVRSLESSLPMQMLPEPKAFPYPRFRYGIDLSEAQEDIEQRPSASPYQIDTELSRSDYLIRCPGIAQVSDETPRVLTHIFEHSSLDYTTELVVVDPPWLGYKGAAAFNWVNLGLAATGLFGWNAINYLGYLIFSNGVDTTYSRNSGAAVVTNISASVIARTMAVAFGRKFGGFYTSGGAAQALGIKWDDTTATPGGWTGTGSGSELLLSNTGRADYIVALRPLGFDFLAVLMRKSIWVGYPTGVFDHPADFRHRFAGVGCVHRRSAVVGPGMITFLSDEGVVNFDVNSANIISAEINPELLPLDYTQLDRYVAAYQEIGRRYILCTPYCTWIYEYEIPEIKRPARWFKRSAVVNSVIAYTDQAALVTWNDLIGSWAVQTLQWDQIAQPFWASPADLFFTSGTKLGNGDESIFTNFGTNLTPIWRTKNFSTEEMTRLMVTHGFELSYAAAADANVSFKTPDTTGDFNNSIAKTLPSSVSLYKRRRISQLSEGMGLQAQIEITSGFPQIARLRQLVSEGGPSMSGVAL
jgi:hypothetical protein